MYAVISVKITVADINNRVPHNSTLCAWT